MTKTKVLVLIGTALALALVVVYYMDSERNAPNQTVSKPDNSLVEKQKAVKTESSTSDFDEAWLEFKRAFKPAWTAEFDGNYKKPTIVATNVTNDLRVEFRLDEVAPVHISTTDGEVQFEILCNKLDDCVIVSMGENMDRIGSVRFEKTSGKQMEGTFKKLVNEWEKLNSEKASR